VIFWVWGSRAGQDGAAVEEAARQRGGALPPPTRSPTSQDGTTRWTWKAGSSIHLISLIKFVAFGADLCLVSVQPGTTGLTPAPGHGPHSVGSELTW